MIPLLYLGAMLDEFFSFVAFRSALTVGLRVAASGAVRVMGTVASSLFRVGIATLGVTLNVAKTIFTSQFFIWVAGTAVLSTFKGVFTAIGLALGKLTTEAIGIGTGFFTYAWKALFAAAEDSAKGLKAWKDELTQRGVPEAMIDKLVGSKIEAVQKTIETSHAVLIQMSQDPQLLDALVREGAENGKEYLRSMREHQPDLYKELEEEVAAEASSNTSIPAEERAEYAAHLMVGFAVAWNKHANEMFAGLAYPSQNTEGEVDRDVWHAVRGLREPSRVR